MSNSVRPHRRQPTRLPRPWDSPGKNTGVGCHFLLQCMKVKRESEVAQSCPTLSDPMNCSLPGSSVHGIFQARVLEWVAIAFSNNLLSSSSFQIWPGEQTGFLGSPTGVLPFGNGRLTLWPRMLVTQLCLTLCDPMDYSPPGSSVHEILQARILKWIAIPFSRVSSWPRDWTGSTTLQVDYLSSKPPGMEKATAPHSSTLAWKIPWMEEPGRLQSILRVRHDWATSLLLFTFMHWRRKWQPTPVFLPGKFWGQRNLVGYTPWHHSVRHDWASNSHKS